MSRRSYRLLCTGETWLGSNARGAFMALRRLGHSVYIIDESNYVSQTWRSTPARLIRKVFRPLLVRELLLTARRAAQIFKPNGVFVFKGNAIHPNVIRFYRQRGTPCVNFYPDVSFRVHGKYIPRTLPLYDHIFTTKSWGIADMQAQLGIKSISFLEHGFDPELHRPLDLSEEDRARYGCDVAFIGTWSPKKEALLGSIVGALPNIRLKIWGCQWEKVQTPELQRWIVGDEVVGDEYAKALLGASICLGILSERRSGASSGDLITSRTFNIPACGAFMLHERNEESVRYFKEDEEAVFFGSPQELVEKVALFLSRAEKRTAIARKGRERCWNSGYSLDSRMETVIDWFDQQATRP